MPHHCVSDPESMYYNPYHSYSIHHITIPPGDLIQGMGRLYGSYLGGLDLYFCPSMRDLLFAYPIFAPDTPYDVAKDPTHNQWVGTDPTRMPGRSSYIYRAGDFDAPTVHPADRKLTLDLSKLRGPKAILADVWTLANTRPTSIAHAEGFNVGFTDGHITWNRVDDYSTISADLSAVLIYWSHLDTMF